MQTLVIEGLTAGGSAWVEIFDLGKAPEGLSKERAQEFANHDLDSKVEYLRFWKGGESVRIAVKSFAAIRLTLKGWPDVY